MFIDALQFIISIYYDIHEKLTFQIVSNNLVENDVFDYELNELMILLKQQILKASLPFVYFLHVFNKKKGHNMLVLMFDPRFF